MDKKRIDCSWYLSSTDDNGKMTMPGFCVSQDCSTCRRFLPFFDVDDDEAQDANEDADDDITREEADDARREARAEDKAMEDYYDKKYG